jgi:hypothetical protein
MSGRPESAMMKFVRIVVVPAGAMILVQTLPKSST